MNVRLVSMPVLPTHAHLVLMVVLFVVRLLFVISARQGLLRFPTYAKNVVNMCLVVKCAQLQVGVPTVSLATIEHLPLAVYCVKVQWKDVLPVPPTPCVCHAMQDISKMVQINARNVHPLQDVVCAPQLVTALSALVGIS